MKKSLPSQQELVRLLKAKDKRAFDALYDHYAPVLYTLTLSLVAHPETAQDILQASFIQIWQQGASYDETKGSLFKWIFSLTRTVALNQLHLKPGNSVTPTLSHSK